MPNDLPNQLSKLISTFNSKRVISEEELKTFSDTIVAILLANKKSVEKLNSDTKTQLEQTLKFIETERTTLLNAINRDLTAAKSQIEQDAKAQNDRAFKRLQELIAAIRMPKDGQDGLPGPVGVAGLPGKDGSPDTPEQVRDKLESLTDDERLDASAIKNIEKYFGKIKSKAKGMTQELIVAGIRFLENLHDVVINISNKRQDMLLQYDDTNKRWTDGVALTVSDTAPSNPKINDLWVDIS